MRIASAVALALAAIFNLVASFTYLFGGIVATSLNPIDPNVHRPTQPVIEISRDEQSETQDMLKGKLTGNGLLAWGLFLLLFSCILLTGAVCSLRQKRPHFIYAAGCCAVLAEIVGIWLFGFSFARNSLGFAAGTITIVFAYLLGKKKKTDLSPF